MEREREREICTEESRAAGGPESGREQSTPGRDGKARQAAHTGHQTAPESFAGVLQLWTDSATRGAQRELPSALRLHRQAAVAGPRHGRQGD